MVMELVDEDKNNESNLSLFLFFHQDMHVEKGIGSYSFDRHRSKPIVT